jgi:hypothetical protein
VLSCRPDVADASRISGFPGAGTPAGTVVVPACGLRFHGGTVTAGGAVPAAGELAVSCRPVVAAPAVLRRDGSVLAALGYGDGFWPDGVWRSSGTM